MSPKQDFAQALAGQGAGLRAIQFDFFEFLPAFAFKLSFGKRGFARQFVNQVEQRFGKFGQAGECNGADVRTSFRGKISADAPQVFFQLAAGAPLRAGPHNRCRHFCKPGCAVRGRGIAGEEDQLAVKLGNGVGLRENHL